MTTQSNKAILSAIVAVFIIQISVVDAWGFSFGKILSDLTQEATEFKAQAEKVEVYKEKYKFRKVTWGTTSFVIEDYERANLLENTPEFLRYHDMLHIETVEIIYHFQKSRLIAIEYEFIKPFFDPELFDELTAQFDYKYESRHNSSDSSKIVWYNGISKVVLTTRSVIANDISTGITATRQALVVIFSDAKANFNSDRK